MRIVLDSCAIIDDYYMKGTHFRVLLDRLPRLDGILAIPEVVVEETVNKFREDVAKLNEKGAKYDSEYQRLFGEKEWDLVVDEVKSANAYRSDLLSKVLRPVRHEILPYPSVTHQSVVSRALRRRKPFDSRGHDGYRDALIWETVLGLLRANEAPLHFVTTNSSDFGKAPQLHSQLQEELLENGFSLEVIKYYSSIAQLVEALVLPELPHRDDIAADIRGGRLPNFSLREWSEYPLLFLLARLGVEYLAPVEPGHVYVDLTSLLVGKVKDVQVDGVFELTSGNLLLSATSQLELDLGIRADKSQLQFRDVQELSEEIFLNDENLTKLDMRLNLRPFVRVTLILEKGTHNVLAEAVDEIEVQPGLVRQFHPHPIIITQGSRGKLDASVRSEGSGGPG